MTECSQENKSDFDGTNSVTNTNNLTPVEVEQIIKEMEVFVLDGNYRDIDQKLAVEGAWKKMKETIRANGITL